VSIVIVHMLKSLKHKLKIQNKRPPITDAGMQNLLKKLILFLIIVPIKKSIIVNIKVDIMFKSMKIKNTS